MRTRDKIKARLEFLEKLGLGMVGFSEAVGVDYGTVYRWFHDGRDPKKLALEKVKARYSDWPE